MFRRTVGVKFSDRGNETNPRSPIASSSTQLDAFETLLLLHSACAEQEESDQRKKLMEATRAASICSGSRLPLTYSVPGNKSIARRWTSTTFSPFLVKSMATQKPLPSVSLTVGSRKSSTVFPLGEKGPRSSPITGTPPIKLLTRVEQLKLLSKAEKAGLLSAAENFGFSLSAIEKLGLLSKAEELGVLSAATDPATPGALLTLSLGLLLLGPLSVFLVPEDNLVEVGLQVVVALVCVVGGSAAFAASNLVSNLQKST
ncbi:hypothetical protein L6164_011255 [Bauhinia variegata]|uniref:Uncharacterized protein n=1 Tax=Bauhinia variegata TaxID=167791 RepID=A0ACB9P7X1_BAUVA|nr:hypothetical protein L6164_011255 [Bauhinia variegata]